MAQRLRYSHLALDRVGDIDRLSDDLDIIDVGKGIQQPGAQALVGTSEVPLGVRIRIDDIKRIDHRTEGHFPRCKERG